MKQKSIFFSVLAMMMVTMLSVGLASCGDDSESDDDVTLIGTWSLNFNKDSYCLLTFYQNGTVKYQEYDHGEWKEDEVYHYTYSKGILLITYENGQEREKIEVISLSKDKLVLKDWPDGGVNTFIRQ